METGHIPLSQEKQDVELNKATETAFSNCPCRSVHWPGPEALPEVLSSPSWLAWMWSLAWERGGMGCIGTESRTLRNSPK